MQIKRLHQFDVSIKQAITIQRSLASKVLRHNDVLFPHFIAGLDVSVNKQDDATAAAVIISYPDLKVVETAVVQGKVQFPYVPGLLSFREIPLTLQACEKLKLQPDLVMVDGQGIAHPRRFGLASHLGLFLDLPTIGCAKSLLYGKYPEPGTSAGCYTYLKAENGETIGAALRTKDNVKPLIISIGHRIDLPSAIHWVLQCCKGYRLPETTRYAHLVSKGNL